MARGTELHSSALRYLRRKHKIKSLKKTLKVLKNSSPKLYVMSVSDADSYSFVSFGSFVKTHTCLVRKLECLFSHRDDRNTFPLHKGCLLLHHYARRVKPAQLRQMLAQHNRLSPVQVATLVYTTFPLP